MEEKTSFESKFLIPLAIVVAGALVAGAIYMGDKSPSAGYPSGQAKQEIEFDGLSDKDHVLNGSSAEIFVVEYSDTECPFCKVFHNTMKSVLSIYGNRVGWIYRQLPIPQLHARAMSEAIATECIADLGGNTAFWSYLDKIFVATNSNDSLDPTLLPKFAKDVGVDTTAFNNCVKDPKIEERVKESIEAGYDAGAQGTPYSLIVDKKGKVLETINGAEPLDMVRVKIDALLK